MLTKSIDVRKRRSFVMLDGVVSSIISFPRVSEVACHCRCHSFVQIISPLEIPSMTEKNSFDQIIRVFVVAQDTLSRSLFHTISSSSSSPFPLLEVGLLAGSGSNLVCGGKPYVDFEVRGSDRPMVA